MRRLSSAPGQYESGDVMPEQRILDFYVEQSVMTRPGPYGTLFDDLPADLAELVEIVQGLLMYEDVASGFYFR
jgi:hypothetical protein